MPVVSAIPSRRVLEEPCAVKKRQNGRLKKALKERESSKKKKGSCLAEGVVGIQSVHVLSRERDRKTDFPREKPASSYSRQELNGNFLLVEVKDTSSTVAQFHSEDLKQSFRDFEFTCCEYRE